MLLDGCRHAHDARAPKYVGVQLTHFHKHCKQAQIVYIKTSIIFYHWFNTKALGSIRIPDKVVINNFLHEHLIFLTS